MNLYGRIGLYSSIALFVLLFNAFGTESKWLSFDTKETESINTAYLDTLHFPKATILDDTLRGCNFEMDFPGVVVIEEEKFKQIYHHVNMEKFGKLGQTGAPALPMRIFQIAVPQGATASVQVSKSSEKKEISGYLPFPALAPASDKIGAKEPPFQVDSRVYNGGTLFPQEPVAIIGYRTISGTTIALVRVCPVQYDPTSQSFVVYRNLSFRVSFSGSATEAVLKSRSQQPVLNNIITNPSVISNTRDDIDAVCGRLLIVTTNEFKVAADSLALWKSQMGYQVFTVSAASWASSQQVKDTIHSYASRYNIDFFVILGDNDDVPSYQSTLDYAHVTDLYYACLDGASDFYPDLGYGRISVSTASEALMVIKKIVDYERNPVTNAPFYNHACAAAYFQDYNDYNSYADRRFAQTAHEMRTSLIRKGYSVDKIFFTESNVTPLYWNNGYYSNGAPVPDSLRKPTFPWTGNSTDISNAINQGRFLVFHRDHGGEIEWGEPSYTTTHISALSNGRLLPVVLSLNCLTGKFDYGSPCFCETFLRHSNGGAVGLVGATEVSYSGQNDGMAEGIIDAIWPDPLLVPNFPHNPNPNLDPHAPIYQMGLALNQGKFRMTDTWNGGSAPFAYEQYSYELFHWFGDPTMRIWTISPRTLTATYSSALSIGQTSFTISNANCGTGMATLWLKNARTILGSSPISGGNATINFSSPLIALDTAILTITSQDYRPIQVALQIIPGGSFITPLTPGANDTFDFGQIVPISWQTFGTIPNVKLLSGRLNNSDTIWTTITNATSNTNSYSWTAPSTAGRYCIRIIGIVSPDSIKATTQFFTIMDISYVSGRVLNAANAIIHYIGPKSGTVSENTDSTYSIPRLIPGTYSIFATLGAFSSDTMIPIVPPNKTNVNLTLKYPRISVSPSFLKEQLNAGSSKIDTLRITNIGAANLSISVSAPLESEMVERSLALDLSKTCENGYCTDGNDGPARKIGDAVVPFPFFDGFESGNFNNWTSNGGSYTRMITTTALHGSYSFSIIGGSSAHYDGVEASFSTSQAPPEISFAVRSASTTLASAYFVLGPTGSSCPIFFFMRDNGKLYVNGDTSVAYTSNTWYKIRFSINWIAKTFNYYVNDVLKASAIPFRNAVSSFNTIYLYNFHNNQVWYDDISVGNGAVPWMTYAPSVATVLPGQTVPIAVTFNSGNNISGTYNKTLTISHNVPGVNSISVPCTLVVNSAPVIATPDTVKILGVFKGKDSTVVMGIKNSGNDTLRVSNLQISNALFSTTKTVPFKIPPFDSVDVAIKYSPTITGTNSGEMIITSNAANAPSRHVRFVGSCILGPKIEVTPSIINSAVKPDSSKTVAMQIKNSGGLAFSYSIIEEDQVDNPADGLRLGSSAEDIYPSSYFAKLNKDEVDSRVGLPMTDSKGGPDVSGYRWIDSDEPGGPVYNWTEISGTGTPLTLSDDDYEAVALSFPFNFYDTNYTQAYIGSNGIITFGSPTTSLSNVAIPSTGIPNNFIAPFWDDLNPASGGAVYFQDFGNRAIIEFNAVPHYGSSIGTYTFQVVLQSNGSIQIYYKTVSGMLNSSTIGIENLTGLSGLQVAFNTDYVKDGLALEVSKRPNWLSVLRVIGNDTLNLLTGTVPADSVHKFIVVMNAVDLDLGIYKGKLSINNSAGSTVIVPCTLTVTNTPIPKPVVTVDPVNQTVNEGSTAKFSITATGTNKTYQWQKNGTNVTGATYGTHTTPSTKMADSGALYRCIVSNSAGRDTSAAATLTVKKLPPVVTVDPVNKTVNEGTTAKFSITATGTNRTYQWQKNGTNITGAISVSYTTPATKMADSGALYRCIVSNSAGRDTSAAATLTVNKLPPVVTVDPVNQTVNEGRTAKFSITATGTNRTYQWQKNGTNISGATYGTHTTPSTKMADSGALYRCIVSNSAGSDTSAAATLTVNKLPPVVTVDPVNKTVSVGTTAKFTITATGTDRTYQWQKNAINITGATYGTHTTPVTKMSDNGALYRCIVSNSAGRDTSAAATLTVH